MKMTSNKRYVDFRSLSVLWLRHWIFVCVLVIGRYYLDKETTKSLRMKLSILVRAYCGSVELMILAEFSTVVLTSLVSFVAIDVGGDTF